MQLPRSLALLLVTAVSVLAHGCEHTYKPYEAHDGGRSMTIVGKHVTVEIADKMESRRQGLMGRNQLPPDHGMLFVYPSPRPLGFWMRNTPIPLSIAFIEELGDGKGLICNIEEMTPFAESPSHVSHRPVRLALEMSKGWFAQAGVKAGDNIELPAWLNELVPGEDQN